MKGNRDMRSDRARRRLMTLVPVFLAVLFNLNVLQNGLGWDDELIVPNIRENVKLDSVFFRKEGSLPRGGSADYYYRPLVGVSYLMDQSLWGGSPMGFHLTVLLFHALNTGLVFLLVRRFAVRDDGPLERAGRSPPSGGSIFGGHAVPLLAACLFAVHPAHAEAVAWIAGRNDVLCTTFVLFSLLAFDRHLDSGRPLALAVSMAAFFAALLTKELAVGLILLFPLYPLLRGGGQTEASRPLRTSAVTSILLPALFLGVYFMLRHLNLAFPVGPVSSDEAGAADGSVVLALQSLAFYTGLLAFPFPHRPFIGQMPGGVFMVFSGLTLAGLVALFVVALRRRWFTPAFGILWMLVFLLPALAAAVLETAITPLAERYAYCPSVGFLAAVAWVILRGARRISEMTAMPRREGVWTGVGILIVLIVMLGIESAGRNRVWKDAFSFWQASAASSPQHPYAREQFGIMLTRSSDHVAAESEFTAALNNAPDAMRQVSILNNLGDLYSASGRYSEALAVLTRLDEIDPGNDEVLWHLAELYFHMAVVREGLIDGERAVLEYEEALFRKGEGYLEQALSLRPMPLLYREAGRIYERFRQPEKAPPYYRRVLESGADPRSPVFEEARDRLKRLEQAPQTP